MATTVTIGRDVKGKPMTTGEWQAFIEETGIVVQHWLGEIYFAGDGVGWSDEWGREDAYTWVAQGVAPYHYYNDFRDALAKVGRFYGQEAVAVTNGSTTFV